MERLQPTPGPWRVVTPGYTVQNRHDACIEVVTADYKRPICHVYERRRGQRMPAIPNAELIAAAPALLAACEMAFEDLEQYEDIDLPGGYAVMQTVQTLRAAIAAARGSDTPPIPGDYRAQVGQQGF